MYTKEETASQPQVKSKEQIDPRPAKSRKSTKSTTQSTRKNMATNRKCKLTVEESNENITPTKKLNLIHTTGTPAYRAKMKRQCEPDKVMTSDHTNSIQLTLRTNLTTVGYENLTNQDLTLLEQKRGWLNDKCWTNSYS